MIITQTPLRISFLGGGTDFAGFYRREGGCVVSSAIDKYIFVIIKQRFDEKIRVGYTRTEMVDSVGEVQHELVRESLRRTGILRQVEVDTMGDIPAEGSGLGSSSTVTVGLLNAMHAYLNEPAGQDALAREACGIEIDALRKPIGKQDQYIAAYGGLRLIEFLPDDGVRVTSLEVTPTILRNLGSRLLLFWTGITRQASSVLEEQQNNIAERLPALRALRDMAYRGRDYIVQGRLDDFGSLMDEAWQQKKSLASGVTTGEIDDLYARAMAAGALGGKITGAGGGGFLLFCAPPERHEAIRSALAPLRELPIALEPDGSKVILNYRGRR